MNSWIAALIWIITVYWIIGLLIVWIALGSEIFRQKSYRHSVWFYWLAAVVSALTWPQIVIRVWKEVRARKA